MTLIGEHPNLAVSRTMSKAFAFAGARVGYMAASKGIIDCLRIVRMPYHLSAITQAAALAAFEHTDEQLSRVDHLRDIREQTAAWLTTQTYQGRPLEVAESESNFLLFGGHFADRDRIFRELLDRGVLIRVVGPEGWLRVCMGTDEEMARFRTALAEVLAEPRDAGLSGFGPGGVTPTAHTPHYAEGSTVHGRWAGPGACRQPGRSNDGTYRNNRARNQRSRALN